MPPICVVWTSALLHVWATFAIVAGQQPWSSGGALEGRVLAALDECSVPGRDGQNSNATDTSVTSRRQDSKIHNNSLTVVTLDNVYSSGSPENYSANNDYNFSRGLTHSSQSYRSRNDRPHSYDTGTSFEMVLDSNPNQTSSERESNSNSSHDHSSHSNSNRQQGSGSHGDSGHESESDENSRWSSHAGNSSDDRNRRRYSGDTSDTRFNPRPNSNSGSDSNSRRSRDNGHVHMEHGGIWNDRRPREEDMGRDGDLNVDSNGGRYGNGGVGQGDGWSTDSDDKYSRPNNTDQRGGSMANSNDRYFRNGGGSSTDSTGRLLPISRVEQRGGSNADASEYFRDGGMDQGDLSMGRPDRGKDSTMAEWGPDVKVQTRQRRVSRETYNSGANVLPACTVQCVLTTLGVVNLEGFPVESAVKELLEDNVADPRQRLAAAQRVHVCLQKLTSEIEEDNCEFAVKFASCLNLDLEHLKKDQTRRDSSAV